MIVPDLPERQARARRFSERWKDAKSERSEAQTFINEFYDIFGLDRKSVASFEEHPAGTPEFIDCIQKGKFMIEMKSRGKNLHEAMYTQALGYYKDLQQSDLPQYILACDFQDWFLLDKKDNSEYSFTLENLESNIELFNFMVGKPKVVRSDPVNHKAVEMIGKIFDELKSANFGGSQSAYFLTRVVFCLFADDTGIFPDRNMFQKYLEERTEDDGSDTGMMLRHLFDEVLNKHQKERSKNMSPQLRSFPYIDGGLFDGGHAIPDFNQNMRNLLIKAGEYDWSKVSPAIFGTMFQTVMDQEKRRETGSHYTTEENILKVIRPLFLDQLNKEFDEIDFEDEAVKKAKFMEFQKKLASLKFLDPACGSGNFLVVAYREIRRLEHKTMVRIHGFEKEKIDTEKMIMVNVEQFFGIEMVEFSAKIAEVSLWMMDHMMNLELNKMINGLRFRRIPIVEKPNIVCDDALALDWNELLPASDCSYILGNPPYGGSKVMTEEQREQIRTITGEKGGTLDFVTGWFIKSARYIVGNTKVGFVSTSSITQGEQVGMLWPLIFRLHVQIVFAHQPFKWDSEAAGTAGVSVVIIGLKKDSIEKRLFNHNGVEIDSPVPEHISPYLLGTQIPLPIVSETSNPINGLDEMVMGSQPIDDGHYIFTKDEKEEFLRMEPGAAEFFRPYVNAKELLNGKTRYILALHDIEPNRLRRLPHVMRRVESVKKFRSNSTRDGTRRLADTPLKYQLNVMPENPFLVIPATTSENREYVPMMYLEPPTIPSNATMIVENAGLGLFGLLTSRMHMVWLGRIGGRLESRLRYSAGVVYNTFPVPQNWDTCASTLEEHAKNILDARNVHPQSTLADLYHPTTMPTNLKKAHEKLDKAVEKLYRKDPFNSDDERLGFLLQEYAQLIMKNQTKLQ